MYDNHKKIYFFFDFISHNAWLAWNKIGPLAARFDMTVEPVPVLFAGLLKAHGQVGPAEVPPKSKWMIWNVLRKAQLHGIPIAPPATHPFNPLLALRLCCCELPHAQRNDLIDRIFRATWAEGRAVHEPGELAQVIIGAGMDPDRMLAEAEREPAKRTLRDNTDNALQAGVFGVPSMLAAGELFWGFDDFEFLEEFLQGTDPLGGDKAAYAKWFDVRPSANRRR